MNKMFTCAKWNKLHLFQVSTYVLWVVFLFPKICFNQTFNGQGGLPVPPVGSIGQTSSIANVSGVGTLDGCRRIENVSINLLHTFTSDLAIFIIAPDGTWLELSSQNGFSGNNYQITEFSDSAPSNIITGSPPYNGSFKPEGRQNVSLFPFYSNTNPPSTFTFENTFNGINADGDWTLFINDWIGFDVGFLNSWSITFSELSPDLDVDLGDDVITCIGSDPVIITAIPKSPLSYQYSWSNNNGTPFTNISPDSISTQVTQTTIYTVTVTSLSGYCSGTDEVAVVIEPIIHLFGRNCLP